MTKKQINDFIKKHLWKVGLSGLITAPTFAVLCVWGVVPKEIANKVVFSAMTVFMAGVIPAGILALAYDSLEDE